MSKKRAQMPLRMDEDIKLKLQYIADQNFRPVNKEVERLIIQYINDYEAEHGEINIE